MRITLRILLLIISITNKIEDLDREGMITNLIIAKEKVDKGPNVSKLRNYIDNLENYNVNISKEVKESSIYT